jgi:hypothetical protein
LIHVARSAAVEMTAPAAKAKEWFTPVKSFGWSVPALASAAISGVYGGLPYIIVDELPYR